jgi:hypothetical protein
VRPWFVFAAALILAMPAVLAAAPNVSQAYAAILFPVDSLAGDLDFYGWCNFSDADGGSGYVEHCWYKNETKVSCANYSSGDTYMHTPTTTSAINTWWNGGVGGYSNAYDNDRTTWVYPFDSSKWTAYTAYYNLTAYGPVITANWSLWWGGGGSWGKTHQVPAACLYAKPLMLGFNMTAYRTSGYGYGTNVFNCLSGSALNTAVVVNQSLTARNFNTYIYEEAINFTYKRPVAQGTLTNYSEILSPATKKGDRWVFSCRAFDGATYSNWTNSSALTIENSIPEVGDSYVLPAGPQTTDNLTINYTYLDSDNDSVSNVSVNWFRNATRITALDNSTTINSGNLSVGDVWRFDVAIFDGDNWSTYYTSYSTVIGDSYAPSMTGDLLSTTSGINNQPFTIYLNVTEPNQLVYVKVEVEDPNGLKINYSMTPGTSAGTQAKTFTPSTDGYYKFVFYAYDGSGNAARYPSALQYVETTRLESGGGGGGGGIDEEDVERIVTSATKGKAVFASPETTIKAGPPPRTKEYVIQVNVFAREGPVQATLALSDNVDEFTQAKICDPLTLECSDTAFLEEGGKAYVEIIVDPSLPGFDETFEQSGKIAGLVELLSYGEETGSTYTFMIEKAWLYDETGIIAQYLGLGHKETLTVTYAVVAVVGLMGAVLFLSVFAR